jgi:hypothetical protein
MDECKLCGKHDDKKRLRIHVRKEHKISGGINRDGTKRRLTDFIKTI